MLRQGFELPQPISRTHSEPGPSGSQWTEPRNVPATGSSSEEESKQSPMEENTSREKSDKHADKVEWSSTFISELMAHAAKSSDIPRLFRDIKKMPMEDQEDWLKTCDEEMKSLANRKFWKLVDLPSGRKPIKCRWVFVAKVQWTQESMLGCQGLHSKSTELISRKPSHWSHSLKPCKSYLH